MISHWDIIISVFIQNKVNNKSQSFTAWLTYREFKHHRTQKMCWTWNILSNTESVSLNTECRNYDISLISLNSLKCDYRSSYCWYSLTDIIASFIVVVFSHHWYSSSASWTVIIMSFLHFIHSMKKLRRCFRTQATEILFVKQIQTVNTDLTCLSSVWHLIKLWKGNISTMWSDMKWMWTSAWSVNSVISVIALF